MGIKKTNKWEILGSSGNFSDLEAGSFIVIGSPDLLWDLVIEIETNNAAWAGIVPNDYGDDIFGMAPDPESPDTCIYRKEFSPRKFKDSKEVIDYFIKWSNERILDFEIFIFAGDGEIPDNFNRRIKYWLLEGSPKFRSQVIDYIKGFFHKLEGLISSHNRQKRMRGLEALKDLLDRHPIYKSYLTPKLSELANKFSEAGVIRYYNPEKSKPRKGSDSRGYSRSNLILDCQRLWEKYCKSPTKKNLQAVFAYLEAMKSSKSEKVKKERARCLRAANKEAKRLKLVK